MLGAGVMTRQGGVYSMVVCHRRTRGLSRTRQRMAARTSDGITDQFSPGVVTTAGCATYQDYATVQFDLGCVSDM